MFPTRCHLSLLTLATMARYIRLVLLIENHSDSAMSGQDPLRRQLPPGTVGDGQWPSPVWASVGDPVLSSGPQERTAAGPMDVCGGENDLWDSPLLPRMDPGYCDLEVTLSRAHPSCYHSRNDLVDLTQARLTNPNTPRRHCHSLILDHHILHKRAMDIACLILKMRDLLVQYVPRVFTCTLITPNTHPVCFDYPVHIINSRIRDSMKSDQLIPLDFRLHKWHICQDGIHLNHHGCLILNNMLCNVVH